MNPTDLNLYDRVRAKFAPLRTDDLKDEAKANIGVVAEWSVGWMISAEDGGSYVGQWAMLPEGNKPFIGWVPFCDLSEVERA